MSSAFKYSKVLILLFVVSACGNSNVTPSRNCRNFALVFSGPSGAGKTTLTRMLQRKYNAELDLAISMTTRTIRGSEVNGKDYYFVSTKEFEDNVRDKKMLEYTTYLDNYYGVPAINYTDAVSGGRNIIFNITVQGMRSVKANKNIDAVSIFIAPPSLIELEKRLRNRKEDSESQINKRLISAKQEMDNAYEYDYIIYNCDAENALKLIDSIYTTEKLKRGCY